MKISYYVYYGLVTIVETLMRMFPFLSLMRSHILCMRLMVEPIRLWDNSFSKQAYLNS